MASRLRDTLSASLLSAGNTARFAPAREAGGGREWLRQAGLRVTTPRRVVLEALAGNSHATVAELARPVRSRLPRISIQTIYGVLAAGVEAGLVRRFESAGFGARYELSFEKHDHLMCRACGRLEAVPDGIGLDMPITGGERCGYRVEEIIFRGLCSACLRGRP